MTTGFLWNTPPNHRGNDCQVLDTEFGRYMIRREGPRRPFRAYLNGKRTAYSFTAMSDVKASVERAIRQKRLNAANPPAFMTYFGTKA